MRFGFVVAVLLACACVPDLQAADETPAFPKAVAAQASVEEFATFWQQAWQAIEARPNDPAAADLLLDMVMLAHVRQAADDSKNALAYLLVYHPNSTPAVYLRGRIEKHDEYRELLLRQLNREAQSFDGRVHERFAQAIGLGLNRWGADFIKNANLCFLGFCVGTETNNLFLVQACRMQAKELKNHDAEVWAAVSNTATSPATKYLAISEANEFPAAPFLRAYYWSKMSAADRNSRGVRLSQVRDFIAQRQIDKAIPALENLLAEKNEAKPLFWLAWCELTHPTANKDFPQIAARFQSVIDAFPDAHEARMAKTLLQHVPDQKAILASQLNDVWRPTLEDGALLSGTALEYELHLDANDLKAAAYINYRAEPASLEVIVHSGEILVAYRATMTESMFYLPEDDHIVHITQPGVVPFAQVNFSMAPGGKRSMNMEANLVNSRDVLPTWGSRVAKNVWDEMVKLALMNIQTNELIAGRPIEVPSGFLVPYYTYQISDHDLTQVTCHLDTNRKFTELRVDYNDSHFRLTRISDLHPRTVRNWPDLPMEDHASLDFVIIQRIMGVIAKLSEKYGEKDKSEEVMSGE